MTSLSNMRNIECNVCTLVGGTELVVYLMVDKNELVLKTSGGDRNPNVDRKVFVDPKDRVWIELMFLSIGKGYILTFCYASGILHIES